MKCHVKQYSCTTKYIPSVECAYALSCYLNIAIYKLIVLFAHVLCTVVSIALSWTFRVVIYVSVFPFFISIPNRYRSVSDRIVPFPIFRITEFVFPTELSRFRFRFRIKIWKRKWLGYFPDRSRPLSSLQGRASALSSMHWRSRGVFSSHKISKLSITSITSPITSKH